MVFVGASQVRAKLIQLMHWSGIRRIRFKCTCKSSSPQLHPPHIPKGTRNPRAYLGNRMIVRSLDEDGAGARMTYILHKRVFLVP